jgi:formylmethanofuran dehydrogenase subunit C
VSGWQLTLKQPPALRIDLRAVTPTALAGMSARQVEQLAVGHGNRLMPLAEWFRVTPHQDDLLVFEGDLSRFDRIGWQMAQGRIRVQGPAGHYAGGCMSGGELQVQGSAGLLAGCEMSGGTLSIEGDAGDFAASTLPGSMDGMRGGTLIVKGNAGQRFGDRMRRGTALVFGNAGDFLASRLVAGTIAIGGQAGAHVGYGMRRGSVVFASAAPTIAPTFVPALVDPAVFWQLLARDLARHGGPFEALPRRSIQRHLGDGAVAGKGELICAR